MPGMSLYESLYVGKTLYKALTCDVIMSDYKTASLHNSTTVIMRYNAEWLRRFNFVAAPDSLSQCMPIL